MPKVTVSVPHKLSTADVKEKAVPMIEKTVKDFEGHDLQLDWQGDQAAFTFKSLAFSIKGGVDVQSENVVVEIDLPFAAMMFKDRVQKAITKNLTRALEAAEDA